MHYAPPTPYSTPYLEQATSDFPLMGGMVPYDGTHQDGFL